MTVLNKFDHVIAELKVMRLNVLTHYDEAVMTEVLMAMEQGRKALSVESAGKQYDPDVGFQCTTLQR